MTIGHESMNLSFIGLEAEVETLVRFSFEIGKIMT
jgi:hypothetical protein